jgi:hypothetical protein
MECLECDHPRQCKGNDRRTIQEEGFESWSSTSPTIEAYTPNSNLAEHVTRELKRSYRRVMLAAKNAPECLWDLCLQHVAAIRCHTVLSIRDLNGETPAAKMTGDTPDISHLAEFGWYDWVWYLSPEDIRMERRSLGRYVGHSSDIGDAICARILTSKGKFISRTSVFPLTSEEARSEPVMKRKQEYMRSHSRRPLEIDMHLLMMSCQMKRPHIPC